MTYANLDRIREFAMEALHAEWDALAMDAAFNAAPTDLLPVVVAEGDGRRVAMMRWGVAPGPGAPLVTVARDDSLLDPRKRMFRESAQKRRCCVLSDGFFEWRTIGRSKIPHYYFLRGHAPFAFAALCEPPDPPAAPAAGRTVGGAAGPAPGAQAPVSVPPGRCMVVTTAANELVARTHSRMPVILTGSRCEDWIGPGPLTPERLQALCRPYPPAAMEEYRANSRVSNSRYKGRDAIERWMPDEGELALGYE